MYTFTSIPINSSARLVCHFLFHGGIIAYTDNSVNKKIRCRKSLNFNGLGTRLPRQIPVTIKKQPADIAADCCSRLRIKKDSQEDYLSPPRDFFK